MDLSVIAHTKKQLAAIGITVLSCLAFYGGPTFGQDIKKLQPDFSRIEAALRKHKLSAHDERFLMNLTRSTAMAPKHVAISLLSTAVSVGAVSKQEVLKAIERSASNSRGVELELYSKEYAATLGLGTVPDAGYSEKLTLLDRIRKNPKLLDTEERKLMKVGFSSSKLGNQILAGSYCLKKGNLDGSSRRWLNTNLAKLAKDSKGETKQFWAFTLRVRSQIDST